MNTSLCTLSLKALKLLTDTEGLGKRSVELATPRAENQHQIRFNRLKNCLKFGIDWKNYLVELICSYFKTAYNYSLLILFGTLLC